MTCARSLATKNSLGQYLCFQSRRQVRLRIFLSYHTPDRYRAFALKEALEKHKEDLQVFVDQSGLRAGAFWLPKLGEELQLADAFLLLLGSRLGDWQKIEYYEALDRKAKQHNFPIVPVITVERPPNLPFLSQLHWILAAEPNTPNSIKQIAEALSGYELFASPEPWRSVSPYRGLLALDEEDADFFYGRENETDKLLEAIVTRPGELIALIGNSGVGKSSLVQAGVIGSLKRQRWPGRGMDSGNHWPDDLKDSRTWCYLTMRPGTDPLTALASAFVGLWFQRFTDPEFVMDRNRWSELLRLEQAKLGDLIAAARRHFQHDLNIQPPRRFLLNIDQGEELYDCNREVIQQFSRLIAESVADHSLIAITSQRSDTYGKLQANEDLFSKTIRIDVPPVGREALRAVLVEPPRMFGVTYENVSLVEDLLAQAEGQRGALPLVADFMEELWLQMQQRGDGIIRLSRDRHLLFLGGNLIQRCESFVQQHTLQHETIKKLFTQKLIKLYELGEPVASHLVRSEATDEEWQLLQTLASPTWRLVLISDQSGQPRAEVMHDAIVRQWPRLKEWLVEERQLAIWRTRVESSYALWQQASGSDKRSLLLAEHVLQEIISPDARCKFGLHKGLAEFITASAMRRGSFWQTILSAWAEQVAGITIGKALWAFALVVVGIAALVPMTILFERQGIIDADDGATFAGVGGFVLGIVAVLFLFRNKRRSRFIRLAKNLKREFSLVPRGVGGYLALFIMTVVGLAIGSLYSLVTSYPVILRLVDLSRFNAASLSEKFVLASRVFSYFGMLLVFSLAVMLIIAVLRHSGRARPLAIAFFVSIVVPDLATLAAATQMSLPDSVLWDIRSAFLTRCAISIVALTYFLRSKRVNVTLRANKSIA